MPEPMLAGSATLVRLVGTLHDGLRFDDAGRRATGWTGRRGPVARASAGSAGSVTDDERRDVRSDRPGAPVHGEACDIRPSGAQLGPVVDIAAFGHRP